jgi:hypothetical protein
MDYTYLIGLVLAAIVIILLIKFIQGIFKTVLYGLLILVVISAALGFLFLMDSRHIIEGMKTNTTLFVLKDGNQTITAFTISKMNMSSARSLGDSELKGISSDFVKQDYKKMLGSNYMLFIIDKKAFPKTDKFDPDAVIAYLKGDKKELELATLIKPSYIPDPKAMAFSLLVVYSFKEDSGYLINEYKSGNVIIYPDTFVFRAFRFLLGKK